MDLGYGGVPSILLVPNVKQTYHTLCCEQLLGYVEWQLAPFSGVFGDDSAVVSQRRFPRFSCLVTDVTFDFFFLIWTLC